MSRVLFFAVVLAVGTSIGVHAVDPSSPAPTVPTAAELLASLDANLQSESARQTATMTVDDGRRVRVFRMEIVSRGRHDAAIEYLAPAREKGTRMLKTGDQMWIYLPRAERVQKISGHMMRQGMMGSDMSYEDMMTDADFDEMYDADNVRSETLDGRKTWRIDATAKDSSVTYPKRTIWIDDAWRIPVKQELYALSGLLLKTWTMSEVKNIDGKNVPMTMTLDDALKKGSSTRFEIEEVTYDVPLQGEIFSRRWLERGG